MKVENTIEEALRILEATLTCGESGSTVEFEMGWTERGENSRASLSEYNAALAVKAACASEAARLRGVVSRRIVELDEINTMVNDLDRIVGRIPQ